MNVRTLADLNKNDEKEKKTESFTGGEKSGLVVENPSSSSNPPQQRKVTLYKDGFIVDSGEFRSLDSPRNAQFLKMIKSGFAPPELRQQDRDVVHIALEDRSSEAHRTQEVKAEQSQVFSGTGQRLSASVGESQQVDLQKAAIEIDENSETTDLQFRFLNGARGRQRFNHSHTIRYLMDYVNRVAPTQTPFVLVSGFPPTPIEKDMSKTLKDASLLNETLTQKPE